MPARIVIAIRSARTRLPSTMEAHRYPYGPVAMPGDQRVIDRLLLFGASGDLAKRYLLPAMAYLREAGRLPDDFEVIGAARRRWDDEPPAGLSVRFQETDVTDPGSVARAIGAAGDRPTAIYLALPTELVGAAI